MRQSKLQEYGHRFGDETWQDEWPTEPGSIWFFYGFPYGTRWENSEAELCKVEVFKIGNGVGYIRDGQFMYRSESAVGKWKRIDIVLPPPMSRKDAN